MDSTPSNSTAKKLWLEAVTVWRLGLSNLLARWWHIFLIVGIGLALFLLDRGDWDNRLLQQLRQADNKPLTALARWLSYWGDAIWAIIVAVALFLIGLKCGAPRWRQTGYACLFAVLISGIVVNLFRPTLGRARPDAKDSNGVILANGFYGPHLGHSYHSFPSGHATTAFAPAAAVAAAAPIVGVPCLIFASAVSWSRMQLNQHHPLDVMTGAALGTFLGLCFGTAVPGAKMRMRGKKPGP